jgi:hypothetical protein
MFMKCLGHTLMRITPVKSGECQRCVRLSDLQGDMFIETPVPQPSSPCKKLILKNSL